MIHPRMQLFFSAVLLLAGLVTTNAAPVPCPSDSSVMGYTDLKSFRDDAAANQGGTHVLCPDTVFDTTCTDDLYIGYNDMVIKCGADGSAANSCVLRHTEEFCQPVLFSPNVAGVTLQGITFESNGQTLRATTVAMTNNDVTFEDCHWKNLRMAVPPEVGMARAVVRAIAGNLTLSGCSFRGNVVGWLVFQNEGTSLTIRNTYARCNEMVGELIHVQNPYGQATLDTSCFGDNHYNGATVEASFRTTSFLDPTNLYESGSKTHTQGGVPISCKGLNQNVVGGSATCIPFEASTCSLPAAAGDKAACSAKQITPAPTASPTPPRTLASSGVRSSAFSAGALMALAAIMLFSCRVICS